MGYTKLCIKITRKKTRLFNLGFNIFGMSFAILYSFISVISNEQFIQIVKKDNGVEAFLQGVIVVLCLFALFLGIYGNEKMLFDYKKTFIRMHNQGCGMGRIRFLTNIITIYAAIGGMIFGNVIGVLLCNGFHMLICKCMELPYNFKLFHSGIYSSLLLFFVIVVLVIISNCWNTNRMLMQDMNEINVGFFRTGMKNGKGEHTSVSKEEGKGSTVCFLLGCMLILYSLLGWRNFASNANSSLVMVFAFAVIGIFMVIVSFGKVLITYGEKRKKYVLVSNVRLMYKSYSKLIVALCILLIFSIFFVGTCYEDYKSSLETITDNKPYDLVVDAGDGAAGVVEATIRELGDEMKSTIMVPVLWNADNHEKGNKNYEIISRTAYIKLARKSCDIAPNECYVITQLRREQSCEWMPVGEHVSIEMGDAHIQVKIQKEEWAYLYNTEDSFRRIIVVDDSIFTKLANSCNREMKMYRYLVNYTASDVLNSAEAHVVQGEIHTKKFETKAEVNNELTCLSKASQCKTEMNQQKIMMCFGMGAAAILMGTILLVLYCKMIDDLDSIRNSAKVLSSLGISRAKIRNSVCEIYKILVAIPILFGLVYANFMFTIKMGELKMELLVFDFIYVGIQCVYFLVLKHRISREFTCKYIYARMT